jgi:hypothetical protein
MLFNTLIDNVLLLLFAVYTFFEHELLSLCVLQQGGRKDRRGDGIEAGSSGKRRGC